MAGKKKEQIHWKKGGEAGFRVQLYVKPPKMGVERLGLAGTWGLLGWATPLHNQAGWNSFEKKDLFFQASENTTLNPHMAGVENRAGCPLLGVDEPL